jgi:hypothetical protein
MNDNTQGKISLKIHLPSRKIQFLPVFVEIAEFSAVVLWMCKNMKSEARCPNSVVEVAGDG